MRSLVFFLEEPSARAFLEQFVPRILPEAEVVTRYIVFEGKQDMDKRLLRRMRGWLEPDSLFVVLRDQDSSDCVQLKNRLLQTCREAGRAAQTLVRIACRELESWYLGDLAAVERGLGVQGLSRQQGKRKFRNPDHLGSPSQELLKLTSQRYQKVRDSRALGKELGLDLATNQSASFRAFLVGMRELLGDHDTPQGQ